MGSPFFHELKKQASFFLKEKIKTARLALTDVTPAELLTEEAINGNPNVPDTRIMGLISRAAFEIDDYCRIVEILHKRFARYDKNYWRETYHALILLEHLLTHGPESTATEFQSDIDVIRQLGSFQHIDERGFNWGLNVRRKSERILELLEKGELYKEERHRARKLTRGIEGFGSFNEFSSSSSNENPKEYFLKSIGRCNSNYNDYKRHEHEFSSINEHAKKMQSSSPMRNSQEAFIQKSNLEVSTQSLKANVSNIRPCNGMEIKQIQVKEVLFEEIHEDATRETKPLLGSPKEMPKIELTTEEDHPFINLEQQSNASLLSVK